MSLINCPECNKSISDTALSCPICGYRLKFLLKENKRIIVKGLEENKKPDNITQVLSNKRYNSYDNNNINLRKITSLMVFGVSISIVMWLCSNYIISVPNIIFSIFSDLQVPGKIISYIVIKSLYDNDFQKIVDAMGWIKYVEIIINGIAFGFLIIIIRYIVDKIRNSYQSIISKKSNVAG